MKPLLIFYQLMWTLAYFYGLPLLLKRVSPWLYKRWTWNDTIEIDKKRESIWLHALSLGEMFSITRLPGLIKEAFPDFNIVVTVSTQKAYEYYKSKEFPDTKFTFLPLDFFVPIKSFLDSIRPKVALIVESDIWPFMLWELSRRNVPILLINGRMSPKTLSNYRRFRFLLKPLFSPITKWVMQSEELAERISKTGIADPNKIISVGNLKYDTLPNHEDIIQFDWKELFGFSESDIVWIAGSTHAGEEEIIYEAYKILKERYALLKLVIAPRDTKRVQEVLGLAQKEGLKALRRSEVPDKKGGDVIVVDTVGELRSLYSIADLAFVGGSLVPVGGHNILEPAIYEVPVIFGPFMFNFEEIAKNFLAKEAGYQVKDLPELISAVETLVEYRTMAKEMGRRGKELCLSHRGATQRLLDIIREHI